MLEESTRSTTTWRSTLGQVSRDVAELVRDFAWLTAWTARHVGAAALRRQTLQAIRRRLGRRK